MSLTCESVHVKKILMPILKKVMVIATEGSDAEVKSEIHPATSELLLLDLERHTASRIIPGE